MFGILTNKFVSETYAAFRTLGYLPKEGPFSQDDFIKAAVSTLCRADELSDAICAVNAIQFCLKKWDDIEQIPIKKSDVWAGLSFDGGPSISLVSEEEALGTYYITNAITKKWKELYLVSASLDNDIYQIERSGSEFFIDGYSLKYKALSENKLNIFSPQGQKLCQVVLSESNGIFLKKNNTDLGIIELNNGATCVAHRAYAESVPPRGKIDDDEIVAIIDWDIVGKKSELGVAKLDVYEEVTEEQMYLLWCLAASTFLLYRRFVESEKAATGAAIGMTFVMFSALKKKR